MKLVEFIKEHWGYVPTEDQMAVIRAVYQVMSRVLALLPTGAGKSLCYQSLALWKGWRTVVVSPLLALQRDQLTGIPETLRDKARVINSQESNEANANSLQEFLAGSVTMLFVAPERLSNREFRQALKGRVEFLVIDEAHTLAEWGATFRPDFLQIGRFAREVRAEHVLAMTATATPSVIETIKRVLGGETETLSFGVRRENLGYTLERVTEDSRLERAVSLIKEVEEGAAVCYARTRAECESIAAQLKKEGIKAAAYHAGLTTERRQAVEAGFKASVPGQVRVIVCTIAFGMGVDKKDVRLVLHLGFSENISAYVQEAGRGGRDGQPAQAVTLVTNQEIANLTKISIPISDTVLRTVLEVLKKCPNGHFRGTDDQLARMIPGLEKDQVAEAIGFLSVRGIIQVGWSEGQIRNLKFDGEMPNFKALVRRAAEEVAAERDKLGALLTRDSCVQQGIEAHFGLTPGEECDKCSACLRRTPSTTVVAEVVETSIEEAVEESPVAEPSGVDGYFASPTTIAVKEFQKELRSAAVAQGLAVLRGNSKPTHPSEPTISEEVVSESPVVEAAGENPTVQPVRVDRGFLPQLKKQPGTVDVTVKSAADQMRSIVPTWPMVMGHKAGKVSDSSYIAQYDEILQNAPTSVWDVLESRAVDGHLTVLCYCKDGKFCHTHQLVEFMAENFPERFVDARKPEQLPVVNK